MVYNIAYIQVLSENNPQIHKNSKYENSKFVNFAFICKKNMGLKLIKQINIQIE